jgi:CheY-like chemotaxis protein
MLNARDGHQALDHAALLQAMPYARRYARSLTGGQASGDALLTAAVGHLLQAEERFPEDCLLGVYRAISDRARTLPAPATGLDIVRRMLLLLTVLEEQPVTKAAFACRLEPEAAERLLTAAREQVRSLTATRVLIIEDEPIIALDIQELVERCGHHVVGVAATEAEAVAIAQRERPGLVLADVHLGAGGDGTSAVARILREVPAPVIFVTAHPERLLTGQALEPAFVITKPFDPQTLAVATYQAVTRGIPPV